MPQYKEVDTNVFAWITEDHSLVIEDRNAGVAIDLSAAGAMAVADLLRPLTSRSYQTNGGN